MNTLSSLCFSFGVFALAFLPVNLGGQRSVDELHTYSGHGGDYRNDDTTRLLYGSFTISSNSGKHRYPRIGSESGLVGRISLILSAMIY